MFYENASATTPIPAELRGYALTVSQQRAYGTITNFDARFRRFYADTAGAGGWTDSIRMAVQVFGIDRLVLGSDFPLEAKTPEETAEVLQAVHEIGLDEAAVRQIESENAERLLGLS